MEKGLSVRSLINSLKIERVENLTDVELLYTAVHPEQIKSPGCLFACIDEFTEYNRWHSSHDFMEQVVAAKPSAVLLDEPIAGLKVPQLIVKHPRKVLAEATWLIHGFRPEPPLKLIGVTGTNGKTTSSRLISHLFTQSGQHGASLGTLGLEVGGKTVHVGSYTTPLAPELASEINSASENGAKHLAMEVSSHALALERVHALPFAAAVLTQFTRDHLDFHGTEEAYLKAKQLLFKGLSSDAPAILNCNSHYFKEFALVNQGRLVTYGIDRGQKADYMAQKLEICPDGSRFELVFNNKSMVLSTPLVGEFQVENLLAGIALAHELGLSMASIVNAVGSFRSVPGRMERHSLPNGATAIIDYAHNPDGLLNLLQNCRGLNSHRLIVVFGCGGDRDRGKRPLMGEIAGDQADLVWLTSDNPRTEDPEFILDEIEVGLRKSNCSDWVREVDRTSAIEAAVKEARSDDIVVIAGKGHEDYQLIGHQKLPYSDQEVIAAICCNAS